jgi:formamidopyrimidine-DNA glycosylase
MPELPEVETVRRGLEPVMAGRKIAGVDVRRPDLRFPFPDRFTQRLEGQRVTHLSRRGKYLLAALDGGETLVMHLGMSGRFTIAAARGGKRRLAEFTYEHGHDAVHDHVTFRMSGGATVTYNDARRFGYMLLIETDALEAHPLFRGMGVEPLGNGLDAAYLAARADGKRTDLKAFLMDQRIVAGLGNI